MVNDIRNNGERMIEKKERVPIRIRNFSRLNEVPYDIYLDLSEGKYIKIINKNETFTSDTISKFAKKKVRYFYLEKNEHLEFLENTVDRLIENFKKSEFSLPNSIDAQVDAVQAIHEYVRAIGVNEKIIELTKRVIKTTVTSYSSISKLKALIIEFPLLYNDVAEQAVLVSYISEGLLLHMGYKSKQARLKLGLAAILHDCMLSNDDLAGITSFADTSLSTFGQAEREEFRSHPLRGAEIASEYKLVSEADFIIAQHHELPDGNGFPYQLPPHKIPSHSCIFIVVNNFVSDLCQRGISEYEIASILDEYKNIYDVGNFREPLMHLTSCFI